MASYVKVGNDGDVAPGTVKCVTAGDRRIALFNENGTLVALDDACTHVGGPLSEGLCENGVVTCPVAWRAIPDRGRDGAEPAGQRERAPLPGARGRGRDRDRDRGVNWRRRVCRGYLDR